MVFRARAGNGEDSEGRAGNEGGQGSGGASSLGGGDGGLSRLQGAFARGSARFYENIVDDAKRELGVDIGSAVDSSNALVDAFEGMVKTSKQRAKELQKELQEARAEAQDSFALVEGKYWPQFVEWNRWELWKVSKSHD